MIGQKGGVNIASRPHLAVWDPTDHSSNQMLYDTSRIDLVPVSVGPINQSDHGVTYLCENSSPVKIV